MTILRFGNNDRNSTMCKCGRIATTRPLSKCRYCACGALLHTKYDLAAHSKCEGVADATDQAS